VLLLTLALGGILLPLLSLLAGADCLASEIDEGTLVTVVALPVSRTVCLAGKAMGRAVLLIVIWALAFGSAFLAMSAVRGGDGAAGYWTLAFGSLLLTLSCGGCGLALGAGGGSRLRVLASALGLWLVLVLVVDAVLLLAVTATTPEAPEVGLHGHEELSAPGSEHGKQPHDEEPRSSPHAWLMASTPVDLYRLTALALAPQLRGPLQLIVPSTATAGAGRAPWLPLAVGWSAWLLIPPAVGLWRFRHAILR
jgi:ABC-type transport system involved in multi-copper enzyme maturation permease subunit